MDLRESQEPWGEESPLALPGVLALLSITGAGELDPALRIVSNVSPTQSSSIEIYGQDNLGVLISMGLLEVQLSWIQPRIFRRSEHWHINTFQ